MKHEYREKQEEDKATKLFQAVAWKRRRISGCRFSSPKNYCSGGEKRQSGIRLRSQAIQAGTFSDVDGAEHASIHHVPITNSSDEIEMSVRSIVAAAIVSCPGLRRKSFRQQLWEWEYSTGITIAAYYPIISLSWSITN